eukprot:421183-Rhodomonas_salina.1
MGGLLVATLARAVLLHRVCLRGPRRRFRAQRARIRPRHVLVRPFGARDARIGGGIRVSDVACAVFARVARGPRRGVRLARRAEELSRHVLEGPRLVAPPNQSQANTTAVHSVPATRFFVFDFAVHSSGAPAHLSPIPDST